jgi:hypothetical protein
VAVPFFLVFVWGGLNLSLGGVGREGSRLGIF